MQMVKGGDLTLVAYFETVDGVPLTLSELALADCKFYVQYTIGTSPLGPYSATRYCGNGWYGYDYTDISGYDIVYVAIDENATRVAAGTEYRQFPGGIVQVSASESITGYETTTSTTSPQSLFTKTLSTVTRVETVLLDLSTLSGDADLDVVIAIDGSTQRTIYRHEYTQGTDPEGVRIPSFTTAQDFDIYITLATAEAVRIDYEYVTVAL